jgi:hypothetical protein
LCSDGWLALLRGDHGAAASRVAQCRTLAKTLADERAGADAELLAALAELFQDDFSSAIFLLEYTLSRYRAHGALGVRHSLWPTNGSQPRPCTHRDREVTTLPMRAAEGMVL